jgi:hypothetical protein
MEVRSGLRRPDALEGERFRINPSKLIQPDFSGRKFRPLPGIPRQQNHCSQRAGRWPYCYFRRALDTPGGRGHVRITRLRSLRRKPCFSGALGNCDMQQMATYLRKAPSRIGRRLALLVAIAAASLPDAGV